jgi:hypothetical protein
VCLCSLSEVQCLEHILHTCREGMPSWQWRSEWEVQEEPIAASFREVAAFERPPCTLYKKHHADIVCSVEFSPDGHMLASAGVAKQVSSS